MMVEVEVASWVTKFVGGDGSGRRVLERTAEPGSTVRSVLRSVSEQFPDLAQALWHGAELGENIEVLVNDAVLGVAHTLDTPVRDGDRITLIGQYVGGASATTNQSAVISNDQ